ncbi:MAG: molybdopterin-dependent oxidoreductase, partial [Eggerthellaceae bacterium]|nr:molybdopterin-dependent oxidoreductase [Eggerthellaceae bacterium]
MEVESRTSGFTRRSFLKTAAATGLAASFAGGALSACKPKPTPDPTPEPEPEPMPDEKIYSGACRGFCMGGCALNLHVRDGKLVRCTAAEFPDPRYNRICPKGLTHPHRVYSPNRIQYPLKRTGERGRGEFKRITWDEAINEIATQWKKIAAESGWGAIAAAWLTGNRGTIGGSHSMAYFQRLIQKCGITTLVTLFDAVAIPGLTRHLGQSPLITGNEPADLLNAKFILVWGANPAVCQMQTYHFILEAHAKGAKVINI